MGVLVLITRGNSLCEDPSRRRTEGKQRNTYRCSRKGKTGAFYAKKRHPEPTPRRSRTVATDTRALLEQLRRFEKQSLFHRRNLGFLRVI